MRVVSARNVNDAYYKGGLLLYEHGVAQPSRAGNVLVMQEPVATVYERPWEMVLYDERRDANPFFHLLEAMWMLGGNNDVSWISEFLPSIAQFSDNGETFHGAYGFRWREHFGIDQLRPVVEEIKSNGNSRRIVLGIWDPAVDLGVDQADIPCNLLVVFRVRADKRLHMTVMNRSNDMIWGAYGANAVHFAMLLMYVSGMAGRKPGTYTQISNDFHAYEKTWQKHKPHVAARSGVDPYTHEAVWGMPLVQNAKEFESDLLHFIHETDDPFVNPFFSEVAQPMRNAIRLWRKGERNDAYDYVRSFMARGNDWALACLAWMERRLRDGDKQDD